MKRLVGTTAIKHATNYGPAHTLWSLGDDFLWFDPDWLNHADGCYGVTIFRGTIGAFYADDEGRIWIGPRGGDGFYNAEGLGYLPLTDLLAPAVPNPWDHGEAFDVHPEWNEPPVPVITPYAAAVGKSLDDPEALADM